VTWLDKKLLVTMGTGGVGKTTLSAALAVKAALAGKKVLVMTIDPSQRLKSALGLTSLQGEPVSIPMQEAEGEIWASLLDPKYEFDRFIEKNTANQEQKNKILNNRLYQRLSTSLAGSQEFTAMESVVSRVESKDYDLVILDTPPATNAIDFLRAPQKFYSLFEKDVMSWFAHGSGGSWIKRALSSGTKKAIDILEGLVGKEFLGEIYDFFDAIQVVAPRIQERAIAAQNMFAHQETAFSLVSIYDEAKLAEAKELYKALKRQGYFLKYFFINKVFPFHNAKDLPPLGEKWLASFSFQTAVGEQLKQDFARDVLVYEVYERSEDISSLDALLKLGKSIDI